MDRLLVSTVIPVRRGAPFLRSLVAHLQQIREAWEQDHSAITLAEAILVIDGAEDESETILRELQAQHTWIRVIMLSRSFGRQPATIAGILHTSGDWVFTIDENGQPRAEQFAANLKDLATTNGDVLYIEPAEIEPKARTKWEKALSSITGVANFSAPSSHRLIRGSIARAAAAMSSRQTNFDVALRWFTTRVRHLEQDFNGRDPIALSLSEATPRLQRIWRQLMVNENRLAEAGFSLGAAAMGISSFVALLVFLLSLVGIYGWLTGWLFSFLGVVFLSGAVLATTSILLSYVSAHYLQSLGQPVYFEIDRTRDQVLVDFFARPESHADLRETSQSS